MARWPADPIKRGKFATETILLLARTVGHCHRLAPPIVHRDLKPSNILVGRTGDGKVQLKVTDFGISDVIAQQALDEATRATAMAASFSTPSLIRGCTRRCTPRNSKRRARTPIRAMTSSPWACCGINCSSTI